jgi:hypothetical protein
MKDLEKMAKNGYGHFLRRWIPQSERRLNEWKSELDELELRKKEIEFLINRNTIVLGKDKTELVEINEKYSHLEPEQTVEK